VTRRWAAIAAALVAVVLVAGGLGPTAVRAEDKSLGIPSLDVTALVGLDGSMQVTEVVTYDFRGGPFTVGIRSFERDLDQIESFSAADPDGPLEVVPPSASPSGQWEWNLRQPTGDRQVTFTLTYLVRDAVTVGADVGDLYWQFVGTDRPDIGRLDILVRFVAPIPPAMPTSADTDTTVLRGFVHGPSGGLVTIETSVVRAEATNVPSDRFVEVRAVAPSAAFTAQRSTETMLPGILAEERSYIPQDQVAAEQNDRRKLGWVLTPIIMAIGAIGMAGLWFAAGREQRSTEVLGDYWREPLDEPPAVALANLKRGTIDPSATIAGTLVDLAQRGYLTITGEQVERTGPDTTVHRYRRTAKPLGPDVLPYEHHVLYMVFRVGPEMTSQEMQEWASSNQREAKAALDSVTRAVKAEYDSHQYEQSAPGRIMAMLAGVCAVVAVLSFFVWAFTGNGFGWFGLAAAVLIFVAGLRLLSNRTQAGTDAAAKAAGLKRYLQDFSRLEDAPVGHLILWERYLVYAVALGVSADLVRGMAVRVPEVLNNPAFGVWYVGVGRRFDGFDTIETSSSAIVTAATPNTSGSGGGFSGGGGGGGGGGGFGAR